MAIEKLNKEIEAIDDIYMNSKEAYKANPELDKRMDELMNIYRELTQKNLKGADGEPFSNYLYTRTPGEVEANLVMARRLLSEQQRRNWSPQQMLDWLEETNSINAISGQKHRQGLKFLAE